MEESRVCVRGVRPLIPCYNRDTLLIWPPHKLEGFFGFPTACLLQALLTSRASKDLRDSVWFFGLSLRVLGFFFLFLFIKCFYEFFLNDKQQEFDLSCFFCVRIRRRIFNDDSSFAMLLFPSARNSQSQSHRRYDHNEDDAAFDEKICPSLIRYFMQLHHLLIGYDMQLQHLLQHFLIRLGMRLLQLLIRYVLLP